MKWPWQKPEEKPVKKPAKAKLEPCYRRERPFGFSQALKPPKEE